MMWKIALSLFMFISVSAAQAEDCNAPFLSPQEIAESILSAEEQIQVDLGEETISEAVAGGLYTELQKKKDKLIAEVGEETYLKLLDNTADTVVKTKEQIEAEKPNVGRDAELELKYQMEVDASFKSVFDFDPESLTINWLQVMGATGKLMFGRITEGSNTESDSYFAMSNYPLSTSDPLEVLSKLSHHSRLIYIAEPKENVQRESFGGADLGRVVDFPDLGMKYTGKRDSVQIDRENNWVLFDKKPKGKAVFHVLQDDKNASSEFRYFEAPEGEPKFVKARLIPQDKSILLLNQEGNLREYDVVSKKFVQKYDLNLDVDKTASYQRYGDKLFVVNTQGIIAFVDLDDPNGLTRLTPKSLRESHINFETQFSDDGRFAASASWRKGMRTGSVVKIYDLQAGGRKMKIPTEYIRFLGRGQNRAQVAFAAGGRYLAVVKEVKEDGETSKVLSIFDLLPPQNSDKEVVK